MASIWNWATGRRSLAIGILVGSNRSPWILLTENKILNITENPCLLRSKSLDLTGYKAFFYSIRFVWTSYRLLWTRNEPAFSSFPGQPIRPRIRPYTAVRVDAVMRAVLSLKLVQIRPCDVKIRNPITVSRNDPPYFHVTRPYLNQL